MIYATASGLFLSLCLNVYLVVRLRKKPKRVESLELRQFLADLFGGVGMVAVARVDPDSLILRSPKQK